MGPANSSGLRRPRLALTEVPRAISAIDRLTAMTDRYPMDVGQDGMAPRVMKRDVANLYNYLTGC